LQALISAGVTVGDQEVRDAYRKQNIKIKFDYAVISADDLRKTINPSDGDLEAFFKKNAARYASAVPESARSLTLPLRPARFPAAFRSPPAADSAVLQRAPVRVLGSRAGPSRHILISVPPGADAKTDAAAKAKAEAFSSSFRPAATGPTWPRRTPTTPAARTRAANLASRSAGMMVPEFDNAIFGQKIGDIKIVKSQFGYHIVQVEERTDGARAIAQ
jgi:peptidyl-prolyl cis-trans isomerase D